MPARQIYLQNRGLLIMELIVSEIIEIIKSSKDSLEREEKLAAYIAELTDKLVGTALEKIDEELWIKLKKEGYKCLTRPDKHMQSCFGVFSYKHRYVKGPKGNCFFPLDRELGFENYKRNTPLLCMRIAELSSKTVLRTVEKAVELLTPLRISHQQVSSIKNLVGKCCEQYAEMEAKKELAADEMIEPTVLHVEGDAVVLKEQGKGSSFLHRVQVFEGTMKIGKRTMLRAPHYFSGVDRELVFEQAQYFIENRYKLSNSIVVANSDGGAGYLNADFQSLVFGAKKFEYFLDKYHVNEKLKQRLSFAGKELQNDFRKAINLYDIDRVNVLLDSAEAMAQDEDQENHVLRLRGYLYRNWKYLKPVALRNISNVTGLGVCESGHRVYTYRMKKQGRSWSRKGLIAMSSIITAIKNGSLKQAMLACFKKVVKKTSRALKSASKCALYKQGFVPHIGVKQGSIANYGPASSATGRLSKISNFVQI